MVQILEGFHYLSILVGALYFIVAMSPTPAAGPVASTPLAARAPQQERGQRRVEQILDAAEAVFAEVGVEGASMQAIADRAQASVGSLYHFFPSKDAVVEALGVRYTELVSRANEEAMPLELAHIPTAELFDRVFAAQMRFVLDTPAFPAVHEAVARHCPAVEDTMNAALVGHVAKFLALRYPELTPAEQLVSAMVSVSTVHAQLHLASRLEPAQRDAVIAEAKRMLVSHYSALDRSA